MTETSQCISVHISVAKHKYLESFRSFTSNCLSLKSPSTIINIHKIEKSNNSFESAPLFE